jgi:hypothetical protein
LQECCQISTIDNPVISSNIHLKNVRINLLRIMSTSLQGKLVAIMDHDSAVFFLPLFCEYDAYPSLLSTKCFVVVLRIGWCGVVHKFLYRSRIVVLIDKQNL